MTVALLLLALTPAARAATYYSQPPNANVLTNWNSNPAGGGSTPANFTSGDTFIIQTNHTMTNTGSWTVSGGATIQINSGGLLDGSASTITLGGNLVNNGTIQSMLGTTDILSPRPAPIRAPAPSLRAPAVLRASTGRSLRAAR